MTVPNDDVSEMDDSVRAAALAAMAEQGLTEDNWPDLDEQSDAPSAEDQPEEPAPAAGDEETAEDEPEPEDDAEATAIAEEDVPTEYFGVDLSDLPPEKRQEIIDGFKERDGIIQSVQRRNAELEKGKEGEEASEEPQALDDDALMGELGYDPDDPMYDVKKEVALPLARQLESLVGVVGQMYQERQAEQFESHWNSTLDALESEHGSLPISRDELVDIAIKEQIFDPVDAFNRVAMSGRKTVQDAAAAWRAEAEKAPPKAPAKPRPKPPSTSRPNAANAAPSEPTELLDPTQAAMKAAEDAGLDWGTVLRSNT